MKITAVLVVIVLPYIALASDPSPYAGEEFRQITSLSESDIASLRRGDGMGFAKLAELNYFPGPKHVLAIAEQLNLSQSQLESSRLLYKKMRDRAVSLGEELLAAEYVLDQAFENDTVTATSLEESLLRIGIIRAQLRYTHLEAHLHQKQLLTAEQVSEYDAIRGYHTNKNGDSHHQGSHHK